MCSLFSIFWDSFYKACCSLEDIYVGKITQLLGSLCLWQFLNITEVFFNTPLSQTHQTPSPFWSIINNISITIIHTVKWLPSFNCSAVEAITSPPTLSPVHNLGSHGAHFGRHQFYAQLNLYSPQTPPIFLLTYCQSSSPPHHHQVNGCLADNTGLINRLMIVNKASQDTSAGFLYDS